MKIAPAARIADIGYENAKKIYRTYREDGRRLKKRTIKRFQIKGLDEDTLIWELTKEEDSMQRKVPATRITK